MSVKPNAGKNQLSGRVRATAYSAILAALMTTLVMLGGIADFFDLVFVSVCALILYVVSHEMGLRRALLIYAVCAALSFILSPITTSSQYFVSFLGYYPILRTLLERRGCKKGVVFGVLIGIYSVVMTLLYLLFRSLFGVAGEPVWMYAALGVTSEIFFVTFHHLMGFMTLLYTYKIRPKLFGGKKKGQVRLPEEKDYDLSKRDF